MSNAQNRTAALQSSIRAQERKIADQKSRNAHLSDKIARLEAARAAVSALHTDDKGFVSWVQRYDVGPTWRGAKREEFEEVKRDACAQGETYCEGVGEIYKAICDKITQLENERADGMGLISWAYSCINNLSNELDKALNDSRTMY